MSLCNKTWYFSTSEITEGGSSVLGNNLSVFYLIHGIAIALISCSLCCCVVVIASLVKMLWRIKYRSTVKTRVRFSDRFPLYLAMADALWGISHLVDHLDLVISQTFPHSALSSFLSINLWVFLGYQQLMHAGLALYTYMRVVHGKNIDLGRGEWKLHLISFSVIFSITAVFFPFGGFGPSGFWMLQDVRTTGGTVLGIFITANAAFQALCTTLGYHGIQKVVEKQRKAMQNHGNPTKRSGVSTASECLTTFVLVSLCLYWPLAIVYVIFIVETAVFGIVDPITSLMIVIIANSSGWANAVGYFRNERIKREREQRKLENKGALPTTSTGISSSSGV